MSILELLVDPRTGAIHPALAGAVATLICLVATTLTFIEYGKRAALAQRWDHVCKQVCMFSYNITHVWT